MRQERFIAQLALRLELPQLAFNDEHVCRLVLDEQYVIDLEWVEQDDAIHAYAVLHSRAKELEPRFGELLAANLFGRATHDAVLALDAARNEILLTRKFALEHLEIECFLKQFESLVESVATWSRRLEQHHNHYDHSHYGHDHGRSARDDESEKDRLPDPASGLLRV